ncbi:phage major tail tube protein [Novosphingobium aquae]|uniref:Phage major tail tube protein n=1 Tax=Novosphingobium aquae TaxID=3133435 RepID=A0ABU8S491_9SPHN
MFPRKLKDFRLFNDANSYLGIAKELTLPKIAHSMEDWRGAGMLGPVKIDNGLEAIEFEWSLGGHDSIVVRQAGLVTHDGAMLRFIGAYQSDADGAVSTIEAVVRGRHQEIDFGKAKTGDDTELKIKTVCSYYTLTADGEELFAIDLVGGVYRAGGIDRWADIRAALGS